MSLREYVMGLALCVSMVASEPRDYCQSEHFNVTCPPNNLIVMISASYGRMKRGTCVSGSYGQMGCSEDVLDYMDRKCSGRRHCSVHIPESALHDRNRCPRDLAVYMAADYECVKALTSTPMECSQKRELVVTSKSGYLTSQEVLDHGYGTSLCPWVIRATPGQHLQFTYYNFGGKLDSGTSSSTFNTCYELGVIHSANSGSSKTITTCGSDDGQRVGYIYTSLTNEVTVRFLSKEVLKPMSPFVIKFEARGCSNDITPPVGGWIKYEGKMATIKCNYSEETWFLTCSDNKWNGDTGECADDYSWTFKQTLTEGSDGFPYGILIVVAIGVALGVFIGGLVLSLVYFYMKRKRNPYQEPPQTEQQQEFYQTSSTLKKVPPRSPGGAMVPRDTFPQLQFEDHEHVCTPVPHAHDGYYSAKSNNFGAPRVYDACASSAQRSGHLYESTQVS